MCSGLLALECWLLVEYMYICCCFLFTWFFFFIITCWGGNSSKGDRMKVDRMIKISEKFTTHVPYLGELHNNKTLDKIISISKEVKHPLYRFLNKSKSNRIDGYSHIMTKTERHLRSFLSSAIRFLSDQNYRFSSL